MSLALAGITRPNKPAGTAGTLRRRIAGVGNANTQAMRAYHPWGTADTPQTMIITRVTVTADGATVERLAPLITANGAPVPASAPGRWGQVVAAGHP